MGLSEDIFPTYQPKQTLREELSSNMIEVKLSLRKNINKGWFHNLHTDLRSNNMKVSGDRNNTIIVKGIPPDNDFNQQSVLEIVQQYDSGAQTISSRELHT